MIYENVVEFCRNKRLSISAFEKMCGLGNGTVSKWKNDKNMPSVKILTRIEDSTCVPIELWIKAGGVR